MIDEQILDNFVPNTVERINKKLLILFPSIYIPIVLVVILLFPPTKLSGYIITLILFSVGIFVTEYTLYKSLYWHFSKIKFTPEGIHFYRDNVRYLSKQRFIPWEKILGFNLGKNAAILTINYNPYYLFGEAKEKTPYYFLLYGVKKNPKIKEFIERRYPFIFEQYKDMLEKDGENLKIDGGDV